jgi:hypothetical protein
MKMKTILSVMVLGMITSNTFADVWASGTVGSFGPPTYMFTVNDPTTWGSGQSAFVGFDTPGFSSLDIRGGTNFTSIPDSLTIGEGYAGRGSGWMTVTGTGTKYDASGKDLTVGAFGNTGGEGKLHVLDHATVMAYQLNIAFQGYGEILVSGGASLTGYILTVSDVSYAMVTVSGEGSVFGGTSVTIGRTNLSSAFVEVTDNAVLKASYLTLDQGDTSSFVHVMFKNGGKLALLDSSGNIDTMAELMAAISGQDDVIYIWDGDSYELYTDLAEDVDYFVSQGTDDLSGYAVLTTGPAPEVPEPATMSLLALGGMAMLRRRKK